MSNHPKSILFTMVALFLLSTQVFAAIQTKMISYRLGSTELEGFLAYDDKYKEPRPGVLVFHDWMGVNTKFTKHQTIEMAKLGYVAFAPDIYGKTAQPQNPQQAMQASSMYKNNRGLMRKRAIAGYQALLDQNLVNPKKIVAVGYCFGGTCALELARTGAPLAGIVSFHGGLDNPAPQDAKYIKGPVLVLHGADDPYAPKAQVEAFEKEMKAASKNYQVILYPGAVHAFTNPDAGNDPKTGAAYNSSATRKSWNEFKNFLKNIFK